MLRSNIRLFAHSRGAETTLLPGRNLPDFSAKYSKMAVLSNTRTSASTITGTLALGLSATNSALNCSPLRVSTGMASYGNPLSRTYHQRPPNAQESHFFGQSIQGVDAKLHARGQRVAGKRMNNLLRMRLIRGFERDSIHPPRNNLKS
jgi:hypothetical protein